MAFNEFTRLADIQYFPLSGEQLCLYMIWLYVVRGLKSPKSIKMYLSAVWTMHCKIELMCANPSSYGLLERTQAAPPTPSEEGEAAYACHPSQPPPVLLPRSFASRNPNITENLLDISQHSFLRRLLFLSSLVGFRSIPAMSSQLVDFTTCSPIFSAGDSISY